MLFSEKVRYSETTHYDYAGFTVPMTLSLYNYYSSNNIISIYNWAPDNPQWWITGFNPDFMAPDYRKLYMIGTIDFSSSDHMTDYCEMFDALYELAKESDESKYDYLYFDKDSDKLWIMWGENS